MRTWNNILGFNEDMKRGNEDSAASYKPVTVAWRAFNRSFGAQSFSDSLLGISFPKTVQDRFSFPQGYSSLQNEKTSAPNGVLKRNGIQRDIALATVPKFFHPARVEPFHPHSLETGEHQPIGIVLGTL